MIALFQGSPLSEENLLDSSILKVEYTTSIQHSPHPY